MKELTGSEGLMANDQRLKPDVPADEVVAELPPEQVSHLLMELSTGLVNRLHVHPPVLGKDVFETDAKLVFGARPDVKIEIGSGFALTPFLGEIGQFAVTNPVPEFPHSGDNVTGTDPIRAFIVHPNARIHAKHSRKEGNRNRKGKNKCTPQACTCLYDMTMRQYLSRLSNSPFFCAIIPKNLKLKHMNENKNGFTHVIFLAIGFLVLVITIGVLVTIVNKKYVPKEETPAVSNSTANGKNSWKTYVSNDGIFQFNYPPTWSVKVTEYPWISTIDPTITGVNKSVIASRNNYEVMISGASEHNYCNGPVCAKGSTFTSNFITIDPKDYVIYKDEVLPGVILVRYNKEFQVSDIGNQPYFAINQAVKSSGKYKVLTETPSLVTNSTLYKNKTFYTIFLNLPKELINRPDARENRGNAINFIDKNILAEADQIISTIKFTDKSATADWKTYISKEFGLKFDYPNNWREGNKNINDHGGVFQLFNYSELNSGSNFLKGMNKIEMTIIGNPLTYFPHPENAVETMFAGQKAYRFQDASIGSSLSYTISLPSYPGKYLVATIYGDSVNYDVLEEILKSLMWL